MAATDGQIILAASRFGDITPLYLRDFCKQKLPAISKIVKGQHQNLGVPTLSAPSLQSTALFLNAGKKHQILAQPIKIKEGRKTTNIGSKVLIPETYSGYFELLSEDGRSTRCIDSVLELSKRRNCRVLVRESFRCTQLNRTIHAGELLITINENGKYLQCKNINDEIINLPLDTKAKFSPIAKEDSISGVHTVKNLLLKRMPVIVRLVHGSAPKGVKHPFVPELRLLGCMEIDRIFALPLQKDSDLVPVPINAKLKLQRAKNMEQLEQLIEYTRFLEKAQRLLADARDRLQIVDLKLSQKEKHDFMFNNYNKLPIIVLSSSVNMTAIATNELVENGYMLRKNASIDIYKKTQNTQSSMRAFESNVDIAEEYNEIDHIYDYVRGLTPLSKGVLRFQSTCEAPTLRSQKTDSSDNYCSLIHASPAQVQSTNGESNGNNCGHTTNNKNNLSIAYKSLNNNNTYSNNNNNYSSLESNKQTSSSHNSSNQSHSNYRHQNSHTQHHSIAGINQYQHMHVQEEIKPVPPPIETIPGKKIPEKRQRPVLPKLYLKNINSVSNNNSSNNSPAVTSHQHLIHHNISDPSAASVAGSGVGVTSQYHHHLQQNDLTCKKNLMSTNQQTSYSNINNNIATPSSAGILCSKNSVLEPQSPLFHIRYKSLSNLQLTPESNTLVTPTISTSPKGQPVPPLNVILKNDSILNAHTHLAPTKTALYKSSSTSSGMVAGKSNVHDPREGTLDSSRSGGRTSGDSNKLPEKKTRRLSRPRSLSNLVWDFRPSKEKSKKKLYIHHIDQRQQATLYL